MTGLTIYTGNRLEDLVEDLAHTVCLPRSSPFSPEFIVVQSSGMERWVSLALARLNGICANTVFPFPNTFLKRLFLPMVPERHDLTLFTPDAMTFAIMDILPQQISSTGYENLKTYLNDDPDQSKLYQISEKIAYLFDQYLVFRPEMMMAWESGRADHWQADLWRSISRDTDTPHQAQLQRRFIQHIRDGSIQLDPVLERVSVFGISYLPRFHITVLAELARVIPVSLFLMNPCRFYWDDIVSEYEKKRIAHRYTSHDVQSSDLHLEAGNRLLASWGTLGRNFFRTIHDMAGDVIDRFVPGTSDTILAAVQNDILDLRDRGQVDDSDSIDFDMDPDDSIQIHSCHSPMREIEVLYDRLLYMFETDPELLPNDIIVTTPDIESYAPFIRAVFDTPASDLPRIPYTIADRNRGSRQGVLDGFCQLLGLPETRLAASQILSLLEIRAIQDRFDITPSDVKAVERWIQDTRICWGLDKTHRTSFNIPGYHENTWRAGLERIILGYALPGKGRRMFQTILPYDPIEGESAQSLDRFLIFFETVTTYYFELKNARTLKGWNDYLTQMIVDFFGDDESIEDELGSIRGILDQMARAGNLAGYSKTISLRMLQTGFNHHLEQIRSSSRFISGGITFCQLVPMRSIPTRVICLVGMNHASFPRRDRHLSFDLMARYPKAGDRSSRNDDKYLFLESLISARKRFYISYVGQHIQDNTPIPPAVPVSQLLQYLEEGFGHHEEAWLTRHRLQPFSPAYFKGDRRLFSYAKNDFEAAVQMQKPHTERHLFPQPVARFEPCQHLDIQTLCLFFSHPAKFLLQKIMGIIIGLPEKKPGDQEPFLLDPLDRYLMAQDRVAEYFSDSPKGEGWQRFKTTGEFPHGAPGKVALTQTAADTEQFIESIEPILSTTSAEPIQVDVVLDDVMITGRIDHLHPDGLIRFRCAIHRPKDLINTWIWHLLLCAAVEPFPVRETRLLCRDKWWRFKVVQDPKPILQSYLTIYSKGCCGPVPFFPDASYVYAQTRFKQKMDPADALLRAKRTWDGNNFMPGAKQDPYNRRLFHSSNPIDTTFELLAMTMFEPLLNHMSEIDPKYR